MGKIKNFFKELRKKYRKRKLYKLAEIDASILCGKYFHMLPPEIYIEGDKETMLRETQRVLREFKETDDDWPLDGEEEEDLTTE